MTIHLRIILSNKMVRLRWKFACVRINKVQTKQKKKGNSMVSNACVVSYFDICSRKMSFRKQPHVCHLNNGRCRKNMRIFSYLTSCSRFCYRNSLTLFLFHSRITHSFTDLISPQIQWTERETFVTGVFSLSPICFLWHIFCRCIVPVHTLFCWLNDKCARYTSQHFMAFYVCVYLMLIAWKMLQF